MKSSYIMIYIFLDLFVTFLMMGCGVELKGRCDSSSECVDGYLCDLITRDCVLCKDCTPCAKNKDCDDSNHCTNDICPARGICEYEPITSACCDENGQPESNQKHCDDWVEYRCSSVDCGAFSQSRLVDQYCDGVRADCLGNKKEGPWVNLKQCDDISEMCVSDGVSFAQCNQCKQDTYCNQGQCPNFSEIKLAATDAQAGDGFGVSLSISGDVIVVGAYRKRVGNAPDAGMAYVFQKTENNWTQAEKLTASDTQAYDAFGITVSINDDVIIVGAPYADLEDRSNAGAAYIFQQIGDTWTQSAKLMALDAQAEDRFGHSVSISGDMAIVGVFAKDIGNLPDAGAAYVFQRNGDTWTQSAKLTALDPQANDWFGSAVSIEDDVAIVGASSANIDDLANTGSAYIFQKNRNTWTQSAKLMALDAQAEDRFGHSVSISGGMVTVGSPYVNIGNKADAGAAYVFQKNGDTWTQATKLTASDSRAEDRFGSAVSINGYTAIVGAYAKDAGTVSPKVDAGAAFIFQRDGDTWRQIAKLTSSDSQAGDKFGFSVSINEIAAIVGAFGEDGGIGDPKLDAGAAYIF